MNATENRMVELLVQDARAIVRSEAQSLLAVAERLGESTALAIELIRGRTGPDLPGILVVSGVGKSGLAGQRLSASFASTGTPSHFLHPVEALHGDLGRVRRNDVALLLSYGGETDELTRLIDLLKRMQVPIVSLTSRKTSTLGRLSDLCIELGPIEEACPLRLAPTTSVTAMNAVGDALVLGVMSQRSFSAADFAAYHPAGSLGRKLLKVHQAMSFKVGENFRVLPETITVREALHQDALSQGRRAGAVVLVNAAGELSGIFTDGDLRRNLELHPHLLEVPMTRVMTAKPKRIGHEALASEALAILNRYRIDELPVVDAADHPLGLIDVQDLVSLRMVE